MAYQEHTTVNSHKHVIDLLETFLTAQGWTIDASVNAAERELYVSKANGGETFFFSIKSTGASSIVLRGNTAYPEAGSGGLTHMNLKSSAMVRCWFFAGDLFCHVVVEVAAGYMQMMGFGRLTPYDSFVAAQKEGAFVYGNNNQAWSTLSSSAGANYFSLFPGHVVDGHFRYQRASGTAWATATYMVQAYNGFSGTIFRDSMLLTRLPNTNGDRPMLPIKVLAGHDPAVTAGFYNNWPLGYIPAMRVMSMVGIVNASEQTIGADVWKRFSPPHQNIAITPLAGTGARTEIAFAFLK